MFLMNLTLFQCKIPFKIVKYLKTSNSEHYQRRLVKRLIFGHSSNADAELLMIEKLKSVCVYEFSSKIKRIYEDIKSSAAQQDEFNKKYKDNQQGKIFF